MHVDHITQHYDIGHTRNVSVQQDIYDCPKHLSSTNNLNHEY